MKREKRSFLFWLSLLFYGFLLTGLLLYLRYPGQKVERYIAAQLSKLTGGSDVVAGQCGYGLPLSLSCERVRFADVDSGELFLVVDSLSITPKLSGWKAGLQLKGDMAGGTFSAEARVSPGQGRVQLKDLEARALQIADIPLLAKGVQREIRGMADFSGALSFDRDGVTELTGALTVQDGLLPYRQQILLVTEQEMVPLEVELSFEDGKVQLVDGVLESSTLTYRFAGDIRPEGEMSNWLLSIGGTVTPKRAYMESNPAVQRIVRRLNRQFKGEDLPFMIGGSLRMPRFRFGGQ